jgi:hypothetical protein
MPVLDAWARRLAGAEDRADATDRLVAPTPTTNANASCAWHLAWQHRHKER